MSTFKNVLSSEFMSSGHRLIKGFRFFFGLNICMYIQCLSQTKQTCHVQLTLYIDSLGTGVKRTRAPWATVETSTPLESLYPETRGCNWSTTLSDRNSVSYYTVLVLDLPTLVEDLFSVHSTVVLYLDPTTVMFLGTDFLVCLESQITQRRRRSPSS